MEPKMFLVKILFVVSNLLSFYCITKYLLIRRLSNDHCLYILSVPVFNLGLSGICLNLINMFSRFQYFIFLVIFIVGVYSVAKLHRNFIIPSKNLKRRLTKEEQLSLPIKNNEKLLSIGFYFVSFISSMVLIFLNY